MGVEKSTRSDRSNVFSLAMATEEDAFPFSSIAPEELANDLEAVKASLRRSGFVNPRDRKLVYRLLLLGRGDGYSARAGTQPSIAALESSIMNTELDLANQRVIRADVERTRPNLPHFKDQATKDLLSRILTHFCKERGMTYKQGMHEVLALFLFVMHTDDISDGPPPVADIYLCYAAFLDRFMPYAFNSDDVSAHAFLPAPTHAHGD
jgi:hypothetical protein